MKSNFYFSQGIIDIVKQKIISYNNAVKLKLTDLPYFNALNLSSIQLVSTFDACHKVTYKGTEFRKGYFITISNESITNLKIYEIRDLLVLGDNLYIVGHEWQLAGYVNHFASFEVIDSSLNFELLNVDAIDGPPIHVYTVGQKRFVRPKKYFV